MSAPKLIDLSDGPRVYASSNMELQFQYEQIFRAGCYDHDGLAEHPFVVDVGASIGMFDIFLKCAYPDAELLAFEPVPESADILRQNIELHGFVKAVVHDIAIGSGHQAESPFTFYPALPGNSTRYPAEKATAIAALGRVFTPRVAERLYRGRDITVPVERLSAFLGADRPVDLLKVSVGGDELEVLRGIDAAHWPLIRQAILIVQDFEARLTSVCDLLRSHGLEPSAGPAPLLEPELATYRVHATRD
jgi:FkbM family methyltransferase